jgi:hypothetical protein
VVLSSFSAMACMRSRALRSCSMLMKRMSPRTMAVGAMTLVFPSALPAMSSMLAVVPPTITLGLMVR